jgi:hypothetical protein
MKRPSPVATSKINANWRARAHWEDTVTHLLPKVTLLMVALAMSGTALAQSRELSAPAHSYM